MPAGSNVFWPMLSIKEDRVTWRFHGEKHDLSANHRSSPKRDIFPGVIGTFILNPGLPIDAALWLAVGRNPAPLQPRPANRAKIVPDEYWINPNL
jgi:hypothetical protein